MAVLENYKTTSGKGFLKKNCRHVETNDPAGYITPMQTVVETLYFSRQADDILGDEERNRLLDQLAFNPLEGVLIPGLRGIRKLRIPASGRGKRGGALVIYYFGGAEMPVYALMIYAKAAKEDLSPQGRRIIRALINELGQT